jgi:uncharacterized protein (UPF0548 family)
VFLASRPSPTYIDAFLAASQDLPLSYGPVGLASRGDAGFRVDEQHAVIGNGERDFQTATNALLNWSHFDLGWVALHPPKAPIVPRTVVAVLVQHLGFWSLNGCRVLETVGRPGDAEFGFSYGTLSNHAECGEEIFKVSLDPQTGAVTYTIRAASRPRALLAKLGHPVVRSLQTRFRRDSAAAMKRVVAG